MAALEEEINCNNAEEATRALLKNHRTGERDWHWALPSFAIDAWGEERIELIKTATRNCL
jgi:hypothetical protein